MALESAAARSVLLPRSSNFLSEQAARQRVPPIKISRGNCIFGIRKLHFPGKLRHGLVGARQNPGKTSAPLPAPLRHRRPCARVCRDVPGPQRCSRRAPGRPRRRGDLSQKRKGFQTPGRRAPASAPRLAPDTASRPAARCWLLRADAWRRGAAVRRQTAGRKFPKVSLLQVLRERRFAAREDSARGGAAGAAWRCGANPCAWRGAGGGFPSRCREFRGSQTGVQRRATPRRAPRLAPSPARAQHARRAEGAQ
jgi:hypothetical protein